MISSRRPAPVTSALTCGATPAPLRLLTLVAAVGLAGCAAVTPTASSSREPAPGMIRGFEGAPQDGDSNEREIKGPPRNMQSQGQMPQGVGYNNPGGEVMPQAVPQGGDTHYHVHYHGNAAPAPTGYTPPSYGAPRPNNNLQSMNPYNQMPSTPMGTGGGGAGWYGPSGDGGPTGVRQGFGVGGWGTGGSYGSYNNSGWWNGYTD